MTLFLSTTIAYVGLLLLTRPDPTSLKDRPITLAENVRDIRASILLGIVVLLGYAVTTEFGFITVNEEVFVRLALSNDFENPQFRPSQFLTHSFVHANLVHVLTNVIGLGIASLYERRVGTGRFLAVFTVGIAASIPSLYFYSETITVCGISGGVFAVAAAYFTDEVDTSLADWVKGLLLFVFLVSVMVLQGEFRLSPHDVSGLSVDHVGHILGAIGGIAYCRLWPRTQLVASGAN